MRKLFERLRAHVRRHTGLEASFCFLLPSRAEVPEPSEQGERPCAGEKESGSSLGRQVGQEWSQRRTTTFLWRDKVQ